MGLTGLVTVITATSAEGSELGGGRGMMSGEVRCVGIVG